MSSLFTGAQLAAPCCARLIPSLTSVALRPPLGLHLMQRRQRLADAARAGPDIGRQVLQDAAQVTGPLALRRLVH